MAFGVLGSGFASMGLLEFLRVCVYMESVSPVLWWQARGTRGWKHVFSRSVVGRRPGRICPFLSSDLGAGGVGRLGEGRNSFPSSG